MQSAVYSDLFFTAMEDMKFDMQMENRLYSFFSDLLAGQNDKVVQEDEQNGSIWKYWEEEL